MNLFFELDHGGRVSRAAGESDDRLAGRKRKSAEAHSAPALFTFTSGAVLLVLDRAQG